MIENLRMYLTTYIWKINIKLCLNSSVKYCVSSQIPTKSLKKEVCGTGGLSLKHKCVGV